jgi:predicted DNA-binding ArsR family transcriptional regulator
VLTGLGKESYDYYINAKSDWRVDENGHRPEKIFTNLYATTCWLIKNERTKSRSP